MTALADDRRQATRQPGLASRPSHTHRWRMSEPESSSGHRHGLRRVLVSYGVVLPGLLAAAVAVGIGGAVSSGCSGGLECLTGFVVGVAAAPIVGFLVVAGVALLVGLGWAWSLVALIVGGIAALLFFLAPPVTLTLGLSAPAIAALATDPVIRARRRRQTILVVAVTATALVIGGLTHLWLTDREREQLIADIEDNGLTPMLPATGDWRVRSVDTVNDPVELTYRLLTDRYAVSVTINDPAVGPLSPPDSCSALTASRSSCRQLGPGLFVPVDESSGVASGGFRVVVIDDAAVLLRDESFVVDGNDADVDAPLDRLARSLERVTPRSLVERDES